MEIRILRNSQRLRATLVKTTSVAEIRLSYRVGEFLEDQCTGSFVSDEHGSCGRNCGLRLS